MKKSPGIWYWSTAISLFLVMMFNCGVGYYSLTLFVTPITRTFDISSGDVAVLYTFYGVGSAAAAIFLHKLLKHIQLRYLIVFGGCISAAGYFLFSKAASFPMMYLGGVLIGASTVFAGTAAVQLMIARWFLKKRSQITGLVASASGIGTAIGGPLVGWAIRNVGWRSACMMIGWAVVFFVCIQAIVLLREHPEQMGILPYGQDADGRLPEGSPAGQETGASVRESLTRSYFWLFVFGMIIVAVVYQTISLYQSTILIERGFSEKLAATCLSVFAVVDMCSKAGAGIIADRYGFRIVTLYCMVGTAGAFIIVRLINSTAGAVAFAALLGFWPTMCVLYGVTASITLFGKKYLTEFISFTQTLMCCCSLVGMPLIKRIYNSAGNFDIIINMVIAMLAAFFVMMFFMLKPANLFENREDAAKGGSV